jgi:hypothetical protein
MSSGCRRRFVLSQTLSNEVFGTDSFNLNTPIVVVRNKPHHFCTLTVVSEEMAFYRDRPALGV